MDHHGVKSLENSLPFKGERHKLSSIFWTNLIKAIKRNSEGGVEESRLIFLCLWQTNKVMFADYSRMEWTLGNQTPSGMVQQHHLDKEHWAPQSFLFQWNDRCIQRTVTNVKRSQNNISKRTQNQWNATTGKCTSVDCWTRGSWLQQGRMND